MASAAISRRAHRTHPRTSRAKTAISYAESSESEPHVASELESEQDNGTPVARSRPTRRIQSKKRQRSPAPRAQNSHTRNSKSNHAPKRRKASQSYSPKSITAHICQIDTSGVIPKWHTLPYHILVQIFQYATYPLYEEHTFQPLTSGRWLLSIARLCRAFAEPAFTVLYSSPPLVPMVQAHRLVDLLKADPVPLAFKYRQKVESLRIDVGQVAAYSLHGRGQLDLHGLIKDLPRLVELEFYHQKDMSPYRALDETIKWTYPESLFDALEYVDPNADPGRGDKIGCCRLHSWRWSSRLAGKTYPLEMIPSLHLKPYFISLRKLAFVNYHLPHVKKDAEDPLHEKILADAVKALPNLEHLILDSSTLANAMLLPILPTNLRNLELINCREIHADDFTTFLLTHGSQLRCLTLNHNQSLSLSFLAVLGLACPKLQVLRMNLTYFNLHNTYRDSDPAYDQLILPEQVPIWPTTLQVLEISQMRKWETDAAEMFFQSLLDSAGTLTDLRRLSVQAILNIAWRDRATFRDKWVGSLDRVFKCVPAPPQVLTTIRQNRPAALPRADPEKDEPEDIKGVVAEIEPPSHESSIGSNVASSSAVVNRNSSPELEEKPSPARRSTRTSVRSLKTGKYVESSDESDAHVRKELHSVPPRVAGRSTKLQRELDILRDTAGHDSPAHLSSAAHLTSDESESAPLAANRKSKLRDKQVIQGMCEVVEVRIDNLRPTETQVTEADFLDSERSGDEDWDGEDAEVDGYAW